VFRAPLLTSTQSRGSSGKGQRSGIIDGGDAGSRQYYGDIVIEDLEVGEEEDRVVLSMQDRQRFFDRASEAKSKRTMDDRVRAEDFVYS
jgi:transcription initiation factor TFIIH subunit 1